ncbi:MAG: carboxypeptidase regulatory-like domain-containing protein, partial [Planctomycetes bacterium]|nr:carboxypeptidase regulatory-like domain-containing protein [Planctomycetota bacterium]
RLPSLTAGQAQQTVTVDHDQPPPSITLQLPPGRVVRGRIVSGVDSQPVANALVAVRGVGGQPTLTDADGGFSLELPSRTIRLQVSLADNSLVHTETVRPGQQDLVIHLDAAPNCTLVARVAGLPGHRRVPAVLMRLQREDGPDSGSERPRWVEVQNGELRWSLCPVGRCRVEIRSEGFVPFLQVCDLVAGEEFELGEVLLEPGARVRGTVLDSDRRPIANARVFLGDEADLDVFEPAVRSAADGTFEVSGVSTHSATIVAHAPGHAPRVHVLKLPEDVLGSAPIELQLQPGSVIAVQVTDAPDAGLVQLLRDGRLLSSAALDDAGRAEFFDRSPGDYEVRLHGSDLALQSARIDRPGQTVRVTLE